MHKLHCYLKFGIFMLAAITFGFASVVAEVINVPGDQPSINQGLYAASYGDTVLVAAGTYYENIVWPQVDGISLIGQGSESTIIDGSNVASVIRFETNDIITNATVVDGFTIKNGNALPPWPTSQGGGIFLFYADPVLTNLVITGNTADDFGGGVYNWGASPVFRKVVISNNTAISHGGFHSLNGHATLDHVTVVNNSPGGLYFQTTGYPLIENSIVAGNYIYGVRVDGNSFSPSRIRISYSNTNDAVQLIGYASIDWLGVNIDADPLFIDEGNGDYHLRAESPCIDAGDPSYGYDPDGTITDMGAFYFHQTVGIDNQAEIPHKFSLNQNYPNPFNASTNISYTIPIASDISISIYNLLGQRVWYASRRHDSPGQYSVNWNAGNNTSGVYLARLIYDDKTESIMMTLLK